MFNIFIFHGLNGYPEENWFPWLRQELEKSGHTVIIPQFPGADGPQLQDWLTALNHYKKYLTAQTVLIGHSLGVPFVLNVLEKYSVKAVFLVAGFVGHIDHPFDSLVSSFAHREFHWSEITARCQKFFIFHSDNDPYIKLRKAEELATHIHGELIVIPGAGHINTASGHSTFPLLLEKIQQELKQ